MKVKYSNQILTALLLLISGVGLLAQPETAEMREPAAIEVVKPVVPHEFIRLGITGSVDVTFRLDDEGRPQDIEVVKTTHRQYGESVTKALRQWRFEPPQQAGIRYLLPVVFN